MSLCFRSSGAGIVPDPILVLKLRGVGIADMPLVVRFLIPGVAETEGRRTSLGIRDTVGVETSWSSSMLDMLATDGVCPLWLLRDDLGRRLSVVGLVE
jgi:hypothetical protein